MNELIGTLNPMLVDFHEITPAKCYEIANYLNIDIGPVQRVRMLCDFNVQIDPKVFQRRLAALMPKEKVAA